MRIQDIALLRCIDCDSPAPLELTALEQQGQEVVSGLLRCPACGSAFPIIHKTGVFFQRSKWADYLTAEEQAELNRLGYGEAFPSADRPGDRPDDPQARVASNWEYQWREVYAWSKKDLDSNNIFNEDFFWRFIPLETGAIKGRTVYIACGGRGRETYHVAKHAPSLIIVSEIGAEVYDIGRLVIGEQTPLLLLRCDISHSPLRAGVAEVTICDHALQHVEDHSRGFAELVKATRENGLVGICVYSHENNFLMTELVEPSKKMIHRMSLRNIRALALLPAAAIYLAIRLVYIPLNKLAPKAARRLPLNDHMMFWSSNPFAIVWLSCFDLIHAPISHHFRREEVEGLAVVNGCAIKRLVLTHGTTWSLICQKPSKTK